MSPRDFIFMVSVLALLGGVLTAIFLSIAGGVALSVVAVVGMIGAQVVTSQPKRREHPVIRKPQVGRDWDAERKRRQSD
jgi:hypothetical protein